TAIATGFGASFEKGKRNVEEIQNRINLATDKVDRDLPTFIRERQKDVPRGLRSTGGEENEYDIPTFLRKRVD
ncbi:MAG: cell division protein FtsZ, partial [Syntrophotaleaceae bacterium]